MHDIKIDVQQVKPKYEAIDRFGVAYLASNIYGLCSRIYFHSIQDFQSIFFKKFKVLIFSIILRRNCYVQC